MGRRGNALSLAIVMAVSLNAILGISVIQPALPAMRDAFGMSTSQVGLVITIYTLPALLLVPVTGYLADRYGKKTVLVPSVFIFALAGGAAAFAPNLETLLVLRFIQGFGASSLNSLNVALVPDLFEQRDRVRVMGYASATQNVGAGLLPLVGGALATFGWHYPFLVALAGLPIGIFIIFAMEPSTASTRSGAGSYLGHAYRHVMRRRVLELVFMIGAFTFLGSGPLFTYLPVFMSDRFGAPEAMIGLIIGARALSGGFAASMSGRVAARVKPRNVVTMAFAAVALIFLYVPWSPGAWWLILATLTYGVALGLARPMLQVALVNQAPDDLRGIFASANSFMIRLSQTIGPALAGLYLAFGGFEGLYGLGAAIAFAFMLMTFFSVAFRQLERL